MNINGPGSNVRIIPNESAQAYLGNLSPILTTGEENEDTPKDSGQKD